MLKDKIELVAKHDRFILNKENMNAFKIKKGAKLRGDLDQLLEISESEYLDLKNDFFEKNQSKTEDIVVIDEHNMHDHVKSMALSLSTVGIPDYAYSVGLLKPYSEQIKKNSEDFLNGKDDDNEGINQNISKIVKKIVEESKKMVPGKLAAKAESSKLISNMFNLSNKRKTKLVLTKKNLSVLQKSIDEEKITISQQMETSTVKIFEHGKNIIELGGIRDQLQEIVEIRELYIKNVPEGDKTPEEITFIEKFIKETEKVVVSLIDINSLISGTEQRKQMHEFNRDAFEEVLSNLERIDNTLMPAMIGEYEAYVSNTNLSKSNNVKNAVSEAINVATVRNTAQMKENIKKVYSEYNSPVQKIESLLERQVEIVNVTLEIERATEASRVKNKQYLESLSMINKSLVSLRETKNTTSIKGHLEYIESLKKVD